MPPVFGEANTNTPETLRPEFWAAAAVYCANTAPKLCPVKYTLRGCACCWMITSWITDFNCLSQRSCEINKRRQDDNQPRL